MMHCGVKDAGKVERIFFFKITNVMPGLNY